MNKGPGLFTDIGKNAKDLLTKDYSYDQKFSVSTFTDAGVALTSTAAKKGGISTGDVAAQYKYKDHVIDVKVDTESNISTTVTFHEIVPSTKAIATVKFPQYDSSKVEYLWRCNTSMNMHSTLTTAANLNQSPVVDFSVTLGTANFAFGVESTYETKLGSLTKYNAGISVKSADYDASAVLADKGDTLKGSYVHYLGLPKRSAGVIEIARRFSTNENTITAGGSYAIDDLTVVKARLNSNGKLGALLQHELKPKSLLTISSEIDTKALDKNPRFGLALAMKP
ncbi:hypothetical protein IFM89_016697 [Coptis chinensis]|uniref:Uncharacterized protein n=1 Tax=Coptis chinensis TaxID=261450 RepID=A0A835M686_9MAGN|nr:hypothetical protein IFM89_016697 [Coptis chinensis]